MKEGDTVKKGALLFEIETDKAAMEVEAPSDGIIRNITAVEGAIVPVGQAVALHLSGRRKRFGPGCRATLTPGEAHYTGTSSRCGTTCCTPCEHPHLDVFLQPRLQDGWHEKAELPLKTFRAAARAAASPRSMFKAALAKPTSPATRRAGQLRGDSG